MYRETDNPQVNYSLTALSTALFRLMENKPFGEISVTELCREAQITRRTYYRNCEEKSDLVDYLIAAKLREHLKTANLQSKDISRQYTNFFEYWKGERRFLATLLKAGFFDRFYHIVTECCVKELNYRFLTDFLEGKANKENLRLFHNAFVLGGLCNVLEFWTGEGFATSVDDLVSVVKCLSPEV